MIDAATLHQMLVRYRVTPDRLAKAINRQPETIAAWSSGEASCPGYIEATLQAIAGGIMPASIDRMNQADMTPLGVPAATVKYWRDWQQFPMAARYARAWHDHNGAAELKLDAHDRKILHMVNKGRYFRVRNGWRARPVMGLTKLTTIRLHTPDKYVSAGLLHIRDGELKLTDKGKKELYK